MALDRLTPPPAGDIRMPAIPKFSSQALPNGVVMTLIPGGSAPIVRIDMSLEAGSLRCDKPLIAKATAELIVAGTLSRSAAEIADLLDFYGAGLYATASLRRATVTLICLQKDVVRLVPLMREVLMEPSFPDDEVDLYVAQERQNYDVSSLKPGFHAQRAMLGMLYEPGERYSRRANREDYDGITPEALREFHALAYRPTGCQLFVAGLPSDDDVKLIAETFGSQSWEGSEPWAPPTPKIVTTPNVKYIDMESEQTSVQVARHLMSREHPDFYQFRILDTVFGGYFGSRLMKNIRERLGLTYGIGSFLSASRYLGVHTISSEVRSGAHEQVVQEIFADMRRLAEASITEAELQSLKGYMLGDILRYFENVMASADTISNLAVDGYGPERVEALFRTVSDITPGDLQALASRWLCPDAYSVVCAGKINV